MASGKRSAPENLRPTPAELGILRVLWKHGPATVRDIQEAMSVEEPAGYTTVLKFLQIMHTKGLVSRDESRRAHVYRPCLSQDEAQRRVSHQLIDRVFDGSTSKLVLAALGEQPPTTAKELAEIRDLLDRLEERGE
jgi:predicted transcriptional regulator